MQEKNHMDYGISAGMQKLDHKHFKKEHYMHTKPIFNILKILTVQNLFNI